MLIEEGQLREDWTYSIEKQKGSSDETTYDYQVGVEHRDTEGNIIEAAYIAGSKSLQEAYQQLKYLEEGFIENLGFHWTQKHMSRNEEIGDGESSLRFLSWSYPSSQRRRFSSEPVYGLDT